MKGLIQCNVVRKEISQVAVALSQKTSETVKDILSNLNDAVSEFQRRLKETMKLLTEQTEDTIIDRLYKAAKKLWEEEGSDKAIIEECMNY